MNSWGNSTIEETFKSATIPNVAAAPSTLFHYTTPAGAYGILKGSQIRASNAIFLNDSEEIRYALRIVSEICEEIAADEFRKLSDCEREVLSQTAIRLIDGPMADYPDIFIACFTRDGDDLSQWRGYGVNGRGLSLGFSTRALRTVFKKQSIHFIRVEYRKGVVTRKMKSIVDDWLKKNLRAEKVLQKDVMNISNQDERSKAIRTLGWSLRIVLRRVAACFKDPAFEAEHEYRAILRLPPNEVLKRVQFIPRAEMLRPYVDIDLVDRKRKDPQPPLTRVVVGPSAHSDLSKHATLQFLKTLEYGDADDMVRSSIVPFRPI